MAGPNPFYATPIGRAAGSLAQAFAPDPDGEATALARAAQARLYGTQAGEIENRMGMARAAGDRLRAGDYSPAALAQVFGDIFAGADPRMVQALPEAIRSFGAAAGAPPERLAQLFVGAGGNYAATQPGFEAGQRNDLERSRIAAGPGYARVAEDARQFNATPVPVIQNSQPVYVPRSQAGGQAPVLTFEQARGTQVAPYVAGTGTPEEQGRRGDLVAPGVATARVRNEGQAERINLQGQQAIELQQLRGAQQAGQLDTRGAQRLQELEAQNAAQLQRATLQGEQRAREIEMRGEQQARQAEAQNASAVEVANIRAAAQREAARIRAEGQVAAASGRPAPAIPASVSRGFTEYFQAPLSLQDPDGETRTYRLEPTAQRMLARRAGELYQMGPEGVRGNAAAAIEEALAEFRAQNPPRTDTRMNPLSSRWLGMPAQGGAPAVQPAPQLPPAQTEPSAAAIPPPAQREPGRVYETPRGPMIWTGTGWRPAS